MTFAHHLFPSCLLSCCLATLPLLADEGMWTFDNLPAKAMQSKYGFVPDQAWLDHARLSTLLFGGRGTGSFVSADGLVLTNHHVGHAFIQQVSGEGRDYLKAGFVAARRDQEIRVPGLVLQVLMSTRNVTADVEKAAGPRLSSQAIRAKLDELVKEEQARSGLACESVTLYQGGEYWIYGYRNFEDVRLVMAPEFDIANFGKDWDNFAWPRHDLDFCLFRVYEKGEPYHPAHHLAWSGQGIAPGGMTLVLGHPGRTARLESVAQMEFRQAVVNPLIVRTLERRQKALRAYASLGPEQALKVSSQLMGAANFLKVYRTECQGLQDPATMGQLRRKEASLRAKVLQDPSLRALAGQSWGALRRAFEAQKPLAMENQLMDLRFASLVQGPLEKALRLVSHLEDPDGDPAALKDELEALRPMDRELEAILLSNGLEEALAWLGPDHPLPKALLKGGSPSAIARDAIVRTRLDDPAYVATLLEQGRDALTRCQDPLVLLARRMLPRYLLVKGRQAPLDAAVAEHNGRIARARFKVLGRREYPDATFTLRLGYGAVEPYEAEGTLQQPFTTFGGLFDRAEAWGPKAEGASWALPPRWLERRVALSPSTPFNFISSNDITGGSSGSPLVDRKGELVGLAFDGNIHSIPGRYHYDPARNRSIALDARAILEALSKVYDAPHLVRELLGR